MKYEFDFGCGSMDCKHTSDNRSGVSDKASTTGKALGKQACYSSGDHQVQHHTSDKPFNGKLGHELLVSYRVSKRGYVPVHSN